MSATVAATIVVAYASLAIELTLLHVPSVASSRRLWSAEPTLVAGYSPRYRALFALRPAQKLVLFVLPLLAGCAVYVYAPLAVWTGSDPLGDRLFAPTPYSSAAAIGLIVAGRALALRAASTIRRHNAQHGESFHLHTAGVFRWCRNPGLVGMYLFACGLWLAAPSATLALGVLVYVAHMDFKVRMEEDFLANKFGREYADYRARTGRYWP
jgi:protein-S-isoprenylcysteine O-methyltransferase Ste14